ncbi:MAG: tetratricopeptide repeat protein [Bacteroidetes bacterium]|nr:tetratricopeptide repeat protein [Bacteroidota bacterium]
MSKKKNKPKPQHQAAPQVLIETVPAKPAATKGPLSFADFRVQALVMAIIGFVFYFNSFNNDYALDDGIIIAKNTYVQQGFKGIPNIMGKDAFDTYYSSLNATNQLSGGRYRPLSIVTFAIEQELWGQSIDYSKVATAFGVISPQETDFIHLMHIRHIINVLLYILSAIVLLYFLKNIAFRDQPYVAFIAALIFTIHPIHTEVVANVKSRDEIMSLLFITLTLISAFRYAETKKILSLILGLAFFFLALLSKEYAVTLLVLIPLMLYLLRNYSIPKSLIAILPYLAIFIVYYYLRTSVIAEKSESADDEILNNPYLYATVGQRWASEIAVLWKYFQLLLFPNPLSADYSYKQIPYSNFASPIVCLSILLHIAMVAAMFYFFKKRHILCFAIAFYLVNLLLVSNFIFNIGAPMGERLIYHSSLGFAMVLAYYLWQLRLKTNSVPALASILLVIVILSGYKTIARNVQWKNDRTLFLADVKTVPNSVPANANAGACYIGISDEATDTVLKRKYLDTALMYLNKTVAMHHTFATGFLNRGVVQFKLGNVEAAKADFDTLKMLFPHYPTIPQLNALIGNYYLGVGWNQYGKQGKYNEAIAEFRKGLEADPTNADLWYNIGGAAFSMNLYDSAYNCWSRALQYNPKHEGAQRGFAAVRGMLHK